MENKQWLKVSCSTEQKHDKWTKTEENSLTWIEKNVWHNSCRISRRDVWYLDTEEYESDN